MGIRVLYAAMAVAALVSSSPGYAQVSAVVDRVEDNGIAVVEVSANHHIYLVEVNQDWFSEPLVDDQEIQLIRNGTSYWFDGVEILGRGPTGDYRTWYSVVDHD